MDDATRVDHDLREATRRLTLAEDRFDWDTAEMYRREVDKLLDRKLALSEVLTDCE